MIILLTIVTILLLFSLIFELCFFLKLIKRKNIEIKKMKDCAEYYKKELEKRTNEKFDDYLHLKHK